uniref:Uncharacterized protein n=1 Tax=Anguilla anguilla TaxID=7936 RepID=A0A0E9TGN6_ANGAN
MQLWTGCSKLGWQVDTLGPTFTAKCFLFYFFKNTFYIFPATAPHTGP